MDFKILGNIFNVSVDLIFLIYLIRLNFNNKIALQDVNQIKDTIKSTFRLSRLPVDATIDGRSSVDRDYLTK